MNHSERAGSAAIIGSRVVVPEKVLPPAGVVTECEITEGIPAIPSPRAGIPALVLVRMFSEPLGVLTELLPADIINPGDLASAIVRKFEPQLRERFAECGLVWN